MSDLFWFDDRRSNSSSLRIRNRSPKKSKSIQKTISKEELYKLIDEQQEEDWQASHDENFSAWQKQIDRYLRDLSTNSKEISLPQLAHSIELPLSVIWLTLLLGDYQLEQKGDFYASSSIWIVGVIFPIFSIVLSVG